jgi:hypothetical protein
MARNRSGRSGWLGPVSCALSGGTAQNPVGQLECDCDWAGIWWCAGVSPSGDGQPELTSVIETVGRFDLRAGFPTLFLILANAIVWYDQDA